MTEVLCPSQLAGPKDSDFPEPSVEWFLPQSVRFFRIAGRGDAEIGSEGRLTCLCLSTISTRLLSGFPDKTLTTPRRHQ